MTPAQKLAAIMVPLHLFKMAVIVWAYRREGRNT